MRRSPVEQTSEFVDLAFERTHGNPFFIEEVLLSLIEDGSIFWSDEVGCWQRKLISHIDIPTSVKAMIRKRLDRLDEESYAILSVASTSGKEFDFEVLKLVM